MYITDNYSFGITTNILDTMTDEEAKDYFEDLEADYWIDEYKNNPLI